ncbi:MAG: DnaJ domain-containing protein, partial [Rhodococcus sp. (in: high G+C Gram-positive bacteria)]
MSQREWIEKDFYKELGVSSTASQDDIKKAYRKLARDNHPDANPGNAKAEERFKAVGEANAVLADPAKRKEYDDTRSMFASGGFGRGGYSPGGGTNFGGGGAPGGFDVNDLFGGGGGGGADLGDLFGGLFNRGGGGGNPRPSASSSRPRRGSDLAAEVTLGFRDAATGTSVPLSITSPSSCTTCHGSGAKPGTSPRVCPRCNGAGVVSKNQGAFGFSEPCDDCRGTGSIIDNPCADCRGTGVQN